MTFYKNFDLKKNLSQEKTLLKKMCHCKFQRVGPSTAKGGGRGVFLKRNAKAGTVVGFYNGVRLVGMESKVSEAVRRSPYRMDNDWSRHEEILDIPSHYRSALF